MTRLKVAGVTTDQKTWPGVTHELFGMAAVVRKAKQANQIAAALTALQHCDAKHLSWQEMHA